MNRARRSPVSSLFFKPLSGLVLLGLVSLLGAAVAQAQDLGETDEVLWSLASEPDLLAKANELATPVSIYEFVRNEITYIPYHGARSSSVNSFLGRIGNDVDISSTLIAMLRSQGIRSRYAVATAKIPAQEMMDWMAVRDVDLAASILDDQGVQSVTVVGGGTHVEIEHVWVQAFVPMDSYRAAGPGIGIDCVTTPAACDWVDLAPAFKVREMKDPADVIDIYGVVPFDYDAYYHALDDSYPTPPDGIDRKEKNPLEIYEEQILEHLKATAPGKTLEDVMDFGPIVPVQSQVLPESLPFEVVSPVEVYDNVAAHDAVPANKAWEKQVEITAIFDGGIFLQAGSASLAELSTQRLTLSYGTDGTDSWQQLRLGGTVQWTFQAGPNIIFNGSPVVIGRPFDIRLRMDGPPDTTGTGTDTLYEVIYPNVQIGGYYAISTGGETSNWSQVHRAADQLLSANEQYPVVLDTSDVPHVDENGDGSWDAGDTPLLDHADAMDSLTGGLLYTAQSLYYARLREASERFGSLNHVRSPIGGYLGVVSSTYGVEYLDDTAYAVMPDGLLIDMKGIQYNGNWRIDQPETTAPEHFELFGHVGSSLEHEIWQEITGFDAISTVRGIQFAVGAGNSLVRARKSPTEDTLPAAYPDMGFTTAPPPGWTRAATNIFATRPNSYDHSPGDDIMNFFKGVVDQADSSVNQTSWTYDSSFFFEENVAFFNDREEQIKALPSSGSYSMGMPSICGGGTVSGNRSQLLALWSDCYDIWTASNGNFFVYIDENQEFVPSEQVHRTTNLTVDYLDTNFVLTMRNDLYLRDTGVGWVEYVVPSRRPVGPFFLFNVYLRKFYDTATGALVSQSYTIQNQSNLVASGGWVNGEEALDQTNTSVFENEFFNDQNLVKSTNNDLIKTPSTADPVSTVTGNMYMDETDVTIVGRGLHMVFTRTYNSGAAKNALGAPLSNGWTHSYAMKLVSNDFGQNPNADIAAAPDNFNGKTSSITYTDERGGDAGYLVDDSGGSPSYAITAPTGVFDSLALDTPSTGSATLTFRNGVTYVFDAQGGNLRNPGVSARLSAIADPFGNQLNFTYDASGRLINVDDQLAIAGRTGLTFTYNANNQIATMSDWVRTWTYGYDADQNLATVTNPLSEMMTYRYEDVAGLPGIKLLVEVIKPEDRDSSGEGDVRTKFTYYENGRAFSNANALGQGEKLDYNLFRKGTRVADPRGFIREYFYNEKGLLTKLHEPDGGVLRFDHNAENLRTQKVNGVGFETNYTYLPNTGLLSQETDALGRSANFTYGLFDNLVQHTDKRGNIETRVYFGSTDLPGGALRGKEGRRDVRIAGVDEAISRTRYKDGGNVWLETIYFNEAETRAQQTTLTYDPSNTFMLRQEATVDGVVIAIDYTYDTLGRKLTETMQRRTSPTDATPLLLTTTYTYDDLDRVTSVTDPLGNIHETEYDKNGNVVEERIQYQTAPGIFEERITTRNEFDDADRLIRQLDIFGATTTYQQDEAGQLIKATDPNGHSLLFSYDSMGRVSVAQDENGHREETTYDLTGRRLAQSDGNGGVTTYVYDELGRPTRVTDPLGFVHQFQYDENGNVTGENDANPLPLNENGVTIHREFDEFNQLVREVNAEDEETLFEYDLQGNRTKITDAEGRSTTFVYDTLGRQIEIIDPLIEAGVDKTQTFAYDELGNLIASTDRNGETTHYTYDVMNRLIQIDYMADGTSQTMTYDVFGDVVSVSNGDVTYTSTYDLKHRVLSQTDSRLGLSLSFQYDAAGNIVQKTDYQGEVTTFTYDSSNRLVNMANPGYVQVSYHYDPAGNLLNRILSNGSQTSYEYDANHRLTRLIQMDAMGAVLSDTAYTYDNVGNLKTRDSGTGATVYSYYFDYQLLNADAPGTVDDRFYTYDSVGNRKSMLVGGQSEYHYAHDAGNRLLDVRTGSSVGPLLYQYVYDDNGSMTEKRDALGIPLLSLEYDQRRRVESITISGGIPTNTFKYDPAGYRVERVDSQGTRRSMLQGEHLEAVYDENGNLRGSYLRGVVVDETVNGHEISGTGSVTNLTFHHDHLQSVVALSGHAGGAVETHRYSPFGELLSSTGSSNNTLRYTGRESDEDTGLYYYRARYYDPSIGRFITEDPLGFAAGVNFYAYVGNNPINANDPSGLDTTFFIIRDSGIGTHTAVHVDNNGSPVLYDPGGGYAPPETQRFEAGSGDAFFGDQASISDYVSHHENAGSTVEQITFPTTSGNESTIAQNIEDFGGASGGLCTVAVCSVTQGVGPFESLGTSILPGSLSNELNQIQNPDPPGFFDPAIDFIKGLFGFGDSNPGASGGFVLYPSKPNLNSAERVYSK